LGAPIGMIVIDFTTRLRCRINGCIEDAGTSLFRARPPGVRNGGEFLSMLIAVA
jgi:hypothetical protein